MASYTKDALLIFCAAVYLAFFAMSSLYTYRDLFVAGPDHEVLSLKRWQALISLLLVAIVWGLILAAFPDRTNAALWIVLMSAIAHWSRHWGDRKTAFANMPDRGALYSTALAFIANTAFMLANLLFSATESNILLVLSILSCLLFAMKEPYYLMRFVIMIKKKHDVDPIYSIFRQLFKSAVMSNLSLWICMIAAYKIWPESLGRSSPGNEEIGVFDIQFLIFTQMTGSSSDIYPAAPPAYLISGLSTLIGLFILGVVIAALFNRSSGDKA